MLVPYYCNKVVTPYKKFYTFDPSYRLVTTTMKHTEIDFVGCFLC
jgi:hypothetical protein